MMIKQALDFEKFITENSAVRNGGLFMSAVIASEPRMNKTGNPYWGHVLKIQKIRAAAGFGYEKLVNNRLVREGKDDDFDAQKPKGRHHLPNSRIITESDKEPGVYYMNMFLLSDNYQSYVTYIDKRTGEKIDEKELKQYMPDSKKYSPTQNGLGNKVMIIVPKLENIKELSCGGFAYKG